MASSGSYRPSSSPNAHGPAPRAAIRGRVTLRDIAEAVGVTPMTVSRALRNQERISETTRRKIQAKAEELGYQPDPALTALVHYRHSRLEQPVRAALAWLNGWSDPAQLRRFHEFDLYWRGAAAAAEKLGFHLEEFLAEPGMKPARLAQILHTRNVSGILLPPGPLPAQWIEEFPWDRFSLVALSRTAPLPVHVVTADQASNTMLAMRKMLERGYRRVGFVGDRGITRVFGSGYLWMQALDVPPENHLPPLLLHSREAFEHQDVFEAWLKKHRPDAILTDLAALPEMLAKAGARVPADLGLAGLSVLDCPIDAGIDQNPREIGRVGALMLQSLINDNARGLPAINRQVLIEGSWVDGASLPGPA